MATKYSEKLEKHLRVFYFAAKVVELHTTACLKWNAVKGESERCFARNLTEVLFAALKEKKALTTIINENLRFKQLRLNYLNNQKNKKRTTKISNKLY